MTDQEKLNTAKELLADVAKFEGDAGFYDGMRCGLIRLARDIVETILREDDLANKTQQRYGDAFANVLRKGPYA